METTQIRCPSGLKGRIRKLTARDFHRQTISDDGGTPREMAKLASSLWIETLDPGPYNIEPGEAPRFLTDVLIGDRSYALIQARVFTSGGKRPMKYQCENCGGWWSDVFDYARLPVRSWPDASAEEPEPGTMEHKAWDARRRFAAGEYCSTKMGDGARVQWSHLTGELLDGESRRFAAQFGEGSGANIYTEVASRIKVIEGMDMEGFSDEDKRRHAIFDWVMSYPDDDFWDLYNDIQDHECGPETDILMRCGVPMRSCGHEFGYIVDTLGFIGSSLPRRSLRLRAGVQSQMT